MLSEIDINDWVRSDQPQKLYNVPRDSVISLTTVPTLLFWFDHLDGAYSHCTRIDSDANGVVFHPSANSDVFVWSKK